VVHRGALQDILRAAAVAVPLRLGTTLVSLTTRAAGVSATFTDASSADYDVVVGADGIRSQVRVMCFADAPPRYVGQMYWRTAIPGAVISRPTMMFDPGRFAALLPLGGGLTYLAAQLHTDVAVAVARGDELRTLRDTFADFTAPMTIALDALDGAEPVHYGPAEEIDRNQWQQGRVILIGDAAHACSPVLAQGASLAMEDGVVLSDLLASAGDVDVALAAFVARREPRVRFVRERTALRIALLNSGAPEVDLADNMRETYAMLALRI
jgi:2-polyprenyl-6-methoxyphenol hydroxylase-like FAD-dependent oxidoreductase